MSDTNRKLLTGNDIWKELVKIFDMPKHCHGFTIHSPSPNEPVIIEAKCYIDGGSGEPSTKKFKLIEDDDE